MGPKVGAVAVIAGQQVAGKVGNRHNPAVLCLICRRRMGILLGGNPRRPWASVKQRVPGIVAGVVSLRPLFPAGGYGAFHHGVFFLNIIRQLCIHVIGAGGFRIEAEPLIKLAKHVVHNGLFVFHGKHPNAEILGLIFFPELLAGKSQQ